MYWQGLCLQQHGDRHKISPRLCQIRVFLRYGNPYLQCEVSSKGYPLNDCSVFQ